MRRDILHPWAWELNYEIRNIVWVAKKIEKLTKKEIIWENIWDPVAKWEKIPDWIKNIVKNACSIDEVYWYSPTKWLLKTREFIAKNNPKIQAEDIIFFNGLWDAISKVYKSLSFDARIIWPNPAYSTHSSAEAAHAWSKHITYKLDPNNNWNPDLEELENKVKYNPNIVWILVVNPDNPTWAVFAREVLEKIISIAKEYNLFVIFDEIYEKLVYEDKNRVLLSEIIWDVPWISMKWMSKDLPWPGARSGWIEVYNKDKDKNFSNYIDSIFNAKMMEVCSTTLPQFVLEELYTSKNFEISRKNRIEKYKTRAKIATKVFQDLDLVKVVEPLWAFYLSITFNLEKLDLNKKIEIENKEVKKYIENLLIDSRFDKKFCYYLLAETWICTVPLSWFNSSFDWFRMTLLEDDLEKFEKILYSIKEFIKKFKK